MGEVEDKFYFRYDQSHGYYINDYYNFKSLSLTECEVKDKQ